ncbi:hypothetical protein ACXP2N_08135 [Vibrio alginolyticus]|uniref:hypothetical protein n=1 Tax=Vibrio alginolyticus TaxID=663 RepID=UPI001BD3EB95|nr:hypothetical protein [Vibrio alginolyticus]MBS9939793.1 hypothetical protein [Vibrio alginolyticus]
MESSNNFYELIEWLKKNIDWLNEILVGGETDSVLIDGVEKPSIEKRFADRFSAFQAMVQGRRSFETKDLLLASGEPPADKLLAEVWNDEVQSNNGLYGWTGVKWDKSPYDVYSMTMSEVDKGNKEMMRQLNNRIEDLPTTNDIEFAICDKEGNVVVSISSEGKINLLKDTQIIDTGVESSPSSNYEWAIVDKSGKVAFGIGIDGEVKLPESDLYPQSLIADQVVYAITDQFGNIAFQIDKEGKVLIPQLVSNPIKDAVISFGLRDCETIVHLGGSHVASHYTLEDKAFISNISSFSPFRHQNFGVSGNDSLDVNNRILRETPYFDGKTYTDMNGTYAFIFNHGNDSQFYNQDIDYWYENLSRLIETIQAKGAQPFVCTSFRTSPGAYSCYQAVSDRYQIPFVDNNEINYELGGLQVGPFHQGHPGTRTNGVFWLEMLDIVNHRLPRPQRSIKIFRIRDTFQDSPLSDLLYHDDIGRFKRFQELSLTHYYLGENSRIHCDELDGESVYDFALKTDEYWEIQNGRPVNFSGYALMEIIVPGTAESLSYLEVEIKNIGAVEYFVRDYIDEESSILGRSDGITPDSLEYQEKWDQPRGAWIKCDSLVFEGRNIGRCLKYDKMQILIKGGNFSLSDVKVHHIGEGKFNAAKEARKTIEEDNILPASSFSDADWVGWNTSGSVIRVTPVDNYNSPRSPSDRMKPVDKVCVVSANEKVGQAFAYPTNKKAKFRVTVWCRFYPKAFLNNSHYQLDPTQVIDSSKPGISFDANAELTEKSLDVRTLKMEVWEGEQYPAFGGAPFTDMVCLSWRPVEFDIYTPSAPQGSGKLSFELSCPDGEIQIAKVTVREVK